MALQIIDYAAAANFVTHPIQLSIYPPFECGLIIDCKDGIKIKAARYRGRNMYGLSEFSWGSVWERHDIDPFIKVGSVLKIPHKDNLFDYVVYDTGFPNMTDEQVGDALNELYRVSKKIVVLKINTIKERDEQWWFNKTREVGFYPEVWQVSITGHINAEMRTDF